MGFDYTVTETDSVLPYIRTGSRMQQAGFNPKQIKVFDSQQEENPGIYEAMGVELGNSTQPTASAQPTPPAVDQNPPAAIAPLPAGADLSSNKSPLDSNSLLPDLNKASKTVLNPDGTSSEYDEDGYLMREYDKSGNQTREIWRNTNGSVLFHFDYEYDSNGNLTKEIVRDIDGSVDSYTDYRYCIYDSGESFTREIIHNPDGSVIDNRWNCDREYDTAGNHTRTVYRNADGSVDCYIDYEYDSSGNKTREIYRNPDGSER